VSTLERVESALSGLKIKRANARDAIAVLEIDARDAHEAALRLRDVAGFETNTFVTAIDRFPLEPRFEMCWQFLSVQHNDRVRLIARVESREHTHREHTPPLAQYLGDHVIVDTQPSGSAVMRSEPSEQAIPALGGVVDPNRPAELPSVPTIVDLFPGAAYFERECYDMFGIWFDGHPSLRRLMMPEGYGHYPLRKDFPHQGIEPDRLYREWDAARHRERVEPSPARESVP
jgi:NADH:ubiquinone oxidoreductase subunit C